MPLKSKKKPALLLIEGLGANENIILGLENLEINNKSLKEAITTNNNQLEKIRKMINGL